MTSARYWAIALALLLSACGDQGSESEPPPANEPHGAPADPLADLPRGEQQLAELCARDGDDPIRAVFCADEAPRIENLIDIQGALGVDGARLGGVRGLSVAGHSTSLSARSISAINPRVIIVQLEPSPLEVIPPPYPELLALAFARGEQFVEIMVRDRIDHELRFYLLAFRQACNDAPKGCRPGDLLTPEIERNWLETTLYDERTLANTVLDCSVCHQPLGPGTPKILRMQELDTPWTHWFFKSSDGGQALIADYLAAKGDEPLAGMPASQIEASHPGNLSIQAVYGGGYEQPNKYESQAIEDEVRSSAAALGGAQPEDNSIPGESATWRAGYERAKRGEAIAFPYYNVKITDAEKLARMTEAYRAYRAGELDANELPDIRDVLPDDPRRLAEMGMTTEPGLSGEAVLLQACSTCHNERLDQSQTRARFRANLDGLTRVEKDVAIARLQLPETSPYRMPPARASTLSAEARARAIAVLQQ